MMPGLKGLTKHCYCTLCCYFTGEGDVTENWGNDHQR